MGKGFGSICIATVMVVVFLSGCTHQLEIKNLRSFQNMDLNSLEKKCCVGIVSSADDIYARILVKGVAKELAKCGADVCMPYMTGTSKKVDVVAKISVRPEYKGSGWNFLINFPGFLIFTPAWNGYVYKVNYDVDVLLTKASNGEKIDAFDLPIHLNVRHADFNRTWTEISWLEVGAIALIGGIVFIGYDDNVSQLVADKIEIPIGDYIAQEIASRINSYGELGYIPGIMDPARITAFIQK